MQFAYSGYFAASASNFRKLEGTWPDTEPRLSPSWVAREEQWGGLHGRASS